VVKIAHDGKSIVMQFDDDEEAYRFARDIQDAYVVHDCPEYLFVLGGKIMDKLPRELLLRLDR
jgi:hypothetical protein